MGFLSAHRERGPHPPSIQEPPCWPMLCSQVEVLSAWGPCHVENVSVQMLLPTRASGGQDPESSCCSAVSGILGTCLHLHSCATLCGHALPPLHGSQLASLGEAAPFWELSLLPETQAAFLGTPSEASLPEFPQTDLSLVLCPPAVWLPELQE